MSDARLRELEVAGLAGDLEAYGRYLRERVRQGTLEAEQVELLAYLLWPPAWKALGWIEHGHSGNPAESFRVKLFIRPEQAPLDQIYQVYIRLERWGGGLLRWGKETAMRAGVAAARFRYPSWAEQYDEAAKTEKEMPCRKERIRNVVRMVELAIILGESTPCPSKIGSMPYGPGTLQECLEHEGHLLTNRNNQFRVIDPMARFETTFVAKLGVFAGRRARPALLGEALANCRDPRPDSCFQLCRVCNRTLDAHVETGNPNMVPFVGDHDFDPWYGWDMHVKRREEAVFQAIRDELVPWVLGQGDAVAERTKHD